MLNGFFGYLESQLLKVWLFFGTSHISEFFTWKKNFKSEMVGEILDELEKLIIMEMSIKISLVFSGLLNGHVWLGKLDNSLAVASLYECSHMEISSGITSGTT